MAYDIYATESFEKRVEKLSTSERKALNNLFLQLKENPYVGDPIKFKFFREKRLKEKRIYYLIYEDFLVVLLVAFGGKKTQQETIDEIVKLLPEYKKYIEKLMKNN